MTRLILVRHGQTPSNVGGLLDTDAPGPGLTALGREQAAALPERLAAERIDRVVASPLARTTETAAPIVAATGLPLREDAGLREVLAGALEGRADRASHLRYLDTVFAWAGGDLARRMPGDPETGVAFLERFDASVERAAAGVATVVCVSHGAAIRTWACARAENVDAEHGRAHGLPNTGLVVLERTDGPWRVVTWLDDRFADGPGDGPGGEPVELEEGAAP